MRLQFILALGFSSSLLSSCIVDSDLPLPEGEPQIVVNSILNPDSLIKVQLTRTRPLEDSQPFEVIENATIKLFENGVIIDTLFYEDNGNYLSNRKPKETYTYKILISGPDIKLDIEAEDTVPVRPEFSVCFGKTISQKALTLYDVTVYVELYNLNENQFHPWVEFISQDYNYDYRGNDTTKLVTTKFSYIDSNSPSLDDFNATFDNFNGFSEYAFYLRLSDAFGNSPLVNIEVIGGIGINNQSSRLFRYDVLSNLIKEQALSVNVYNCSPAYDKYLKSTMQDFVNNEFLGTPLPFSGPVKIFSNVKNGAGIIASYSAKSQRVDKFKCN